MVDVSYQLKLYHLNVFNYKHKGNSWDLPILSYYIIKQMLMSVKMETSVIQMPRALTLMAVLHAPAEMELQEMASPVKV
jgi:hypothetical protein